MMPPGDENMTYNEVAQTIDPDLYPDLEQRGGLAPALQRVLEELGTDLIVRQIDELRMFVYAYVERGERHSQVKIAAHARKFHVDFWNQGVQYHSAGLTDLAEVGRAIAVFQLEKVSIKGMAARFSWFKLNKSALNHERGADYFVAEKWRSLLAWEPEPRERIFRKLLPLIHEAATRPALRQLLPFTSLHRLCFSRTTGFPYSYDCPLAQPIESGRFRVMTADEKMVLGEGDVVQAADIIVANLPQDCGPAIHGTAENLKR
jgi:hypothetical protein